MISKRNLVMGVIRGYRFDQLRPFVVSLKRTNFDGEVVFLWNDLSSETIDSLTAYGVKLVHFSYRGSGALNSWSRFWPTLAPIVRLGSGSLLARSILKSITQLMYVRFFAYHDFLAAHKDEYENVLITDVRDVLFQSDPFDQFDGGLVVFEEDGKLPLAEERMCNAMWVEALFGAEGLAQIGQFPILCAGTTMGDVNALIRYLTEFENLMCQVNTIEIGGSDQGIHNYLCRQVMEPWFRVSKNGEGQVLTMVPSLKSGVDYHMSDTGLVLGPNRVPVPVLHQYDRHHQLAAVLLRRLVERPISQGIAAHEG